MIVAGAVALEPLRTIRPPLCHFVTVAIAARLIGTAPTWRFVPVAVALSLVAGLVCHRWVEKPLIAACRAIPGLFAAKGLRSVTARS